MFSSSSFDQRRNVTVETIKEVNLPNPKADNYAIIRADVVNGYLLVEIQYHDCTNYEGKKIMIFKCTLSQLLNQKLIDPHFSNNSNYHSPIARFEPTPLGWENARRAASVFKTNRCHDKI